MHVVSSESVHVGERRHQSASPITLAARMKASGETESRDACQQSMTGSSYRCGRMVRSHQGLGRGDEGYGDEKSATLRLMAIRKRSRQSPPRAGSNLSCVWTLCNASKERLSIALPMPPENLISCFAGGLQNLYASMISQSRGAKLRTYRKQI